MPILLRAIVASACTLPCVVAQTADYVSVTNPYSSATNFNIETVRGMVLHDVGFYAINTHASTVVYHGDFLPGYEAEWPTVQNPVSLAMWQDGSTDRLLVVGGGSWSLAMHDLATGSILKHIRLPAEPADIVIDVANDDAYISCQGDNSVVRIDLNTFTQTSRYPVSSQRPRFMFIKQAANGNSAEIYVTPSLSGNNTTVSDVEEIPAPLPGQPPTGEGSIDQRTRVVDLSPANLTNLPDEDLFRISPTQTVDTPATPVLHGAGTLMTAHGIAPDGNYWLLSTNSLNAAHDSEDKHRGVFANAQLAITSNVGVGARPTPMTIKDLDIDTLGGKNSTTSMSFPWSLAFYSNGVPTGSGGPAIMHAAVASSTSDNITVLDMAGNRLGDLDLKALAHPLTNAWQPGSMPVPVSDRAIPRGLEWDSTTNRLYVYCWGWNKVLVYDMNNPTAQPLWFELGPDPMPVATQEGRSLWYDATRPVGSDGDGNLFHGAVTCNTCHPGGGMDLLGWAVSDSHDDLKDVMVTQSLMSIGDTFPYHWRGERNLDHFNGAFVGILGHATELTPAELEKFESFVFSLQAPANPKQHVDRVVTGAAVSGQDLFLNKPDVLFGQTCADCHQMPSGTDGNRVAEVLLGFPGTATFDVSHLRQLTHKDQTSVTLNVGASPTRARGGFGLAHEGLNDNIREFLSPDRFAITAAESDKITEFMRQFDQGIAPAVHRAYLADTTTASEVGLIESVLLAQANAPKEWLDIAAIGSETPNGALVRWAYDANTMLFTSHSGLAVRTWAQFKLKFTATAATARYLFLGLPPGNAKRFALDPDNDGMTDLAELANTAPLMMPNPTDPRNRDSDADGYDDGYEVAHVGDPNAASSAPFDITPPSKPTLILDHVGATFAKFRATFSEPVSWELRAIDTASGDVISVSRGVALSREATLHMHELKPSTETILGVKRQYTPRLILRDSFNNPGAQWDYPPFFAKEQLISTTRSGGLPVRAKLVITDLAHNVTSRVPAGTMSVAGTVQVRTKAELLIGGQSGHVPSPYTTPVVVARVLYRKPGKPAWNVAQMPQLGGFSAVSGFMLNDLFNDYAYGALPGGFVISSGADANGNATFSYTLSGLAVGDEVKLSVVAILDPVNVLISGAPPSTYGPFKRSSLEDWDLPQTANGPTATTPTAKHLRGFEVVY